jgi:hypothetical protein
MNRIYSCSRDICSWTKWKSRSMYFILAWKIGLDGKNISWLAATSCHLKCFYLLKRWGVKSHHRMMINQEDEALSLLLLHSVSNLVLASNRRETQLRGHLKTLAVWVAKNWVTFIPLSEKMAWQHTFLGILVFRISKIWCLINIQCPSRISSSSGQ